jgi:hypothetical protein
MEGLCRPCPAGECATCSHGAITLNAGWRLNGASNAAVSSQVAMASAAEPLLAFLCPYNGHNALHCPPMSLGRLSASDGRDTNIALSNNNNSKLACEGNHTGILCALCAPDFSRKGSSDNRCESCSVINPLGISSRAFVILVVSFSFCLTGLVYATRRWKLLALPFSCCHSCARYTTACTPI